MTKFYVNEIHNDTMTKGLPYGQTIIGLFKQCETEGRGSFCGYYGSEYYIDAEVYAYYIASYNGRYKPEARISDVIICNPTIKFSEVQIATHMWTNVIEADTIDEAIESFKNAEWRRWSSPFDEPGMIPISSCPICGQRPLVCHMGGPNIDGLITWFKCEKCGIRAESTEGTLATAIKWNHLVISLQVEVN